MKKRDFLALAWFGLKTIIFKQKKPILGTIILTDYCNLSCRHCAVNNLTRKMQSYERVLQEMNSLYQEGIRILFFCGGETLLWEDKGKKIKDLIREARKIGFYLINLVTNGTVDLNLPEADLVFLSLDGMRETHNLIRGDTYDLIMKNLDGAGETKICIYMAVNKLNFRQVEEVGRLAQEHPRINSISFNFHTPYEGTADLSLNKEEKKETVETIKKMIKHKLPVFNLSGALKAYLDNNWSRPCYQCLVWEDGRRYVCGRCVEIEGLCEECGYLFAVEFSLLCKGNLKIITEMLKTYLKYV